MKKHLVYLLLVISTALAGQEKLLYHSIRTDKNGAILPWYSDDPAKAYDHVINLVWNFWDTMRTDLNGLPYYLNHQVWRDAVNDVRGVGGDQLQMALSSWQLLYAYSGNERIKQNMKLLADYYLSHSLSPADCRWPHVPFPYNTLIYSGLYDGDMVIGPGYLQPDKAGSLGLELIHLYKMCNNDFFLPSGNRYLTAAVQIAHTLVSRLQKGDENHSPLPFKVNAFTGHTGQLITTDAKGRHMTDAAYTTNWSGTLELLLELEKLDPASAEVYRSGFNTLLNWMQQFPLKNNKWGPFFEDVQGWSDTQINAITFASFILEHRAYFPEWTKQVTGIFDWVYKTLGNTNWQRYGVTVVNEQSSYQVPGQSHTAREGATELLYCALSGDSTRKTNAVRQLTWATYMVDNDGKNRFPQDDIWLTDGYGDYVRHYIRAMAACPELAPADEDHIIASTSVIQQADYQNRAGKATAGFSEKGKLFYRTFDKVGTELIRMRGKPSAILLNNQPLQPATADNQQGYRWTPMEKGGLLTIHRLQGNEIIVQE